MKIIIQHKTLLWELIKRDIISRYKMSGLGMLWPILNPLLLLAVYSFVFSVVFQARWPNLATEQNNNMFALILFVGLMIHGLAAATLSAAPNTIIAHVNYVKKVVFPLEILPLVPIGSAIFHFGLSLLILLMGKLLLTGSIEATSLLLPVVLLPYLFALVGAAWILASLGVFLRDIGQIIGLLIMILLFLSPIFYPPDALPPEWRSVLFMNPLTIIIINSRNVLLWGEYPDFANLGIYALFSFSFMLFGYWWFRKTHKGFADIL